MNAPYDTIVALSTPSGVGAIGIIRLSGKKLLEFIQSNIAKDLSDVQPNTVHFCRFKRDGKTLDEIVLTYFKAPHSYTGEDVIELSFHGSPYILSAALETLTESGARIATPGEFTQRAFFNGKLDLSQAEAVADLIASESSAEHRLAMHQMRGGFSKEIARLREELINFASLIELELDFSEEDVEFANREELTALIEKIQGFIQSLIDSFRYGNAIKQGVPVAIIGKPNAGKSTLLNVLLNEERAIVSEIAGTTRDAIEDVAVLDGIRYRFIDTAGIRETTDTIESIGVRKSLEKMKSAAIVLYLFDLSESIEEHQKTVIELRRQISDETTAVLMVGNKSDKTEGNTPKEVISISAKHGEGIDALKSALKETIQSSKAQGDLAVTNVRHLQALKATQSALDQALQGIQNGLSGDLVASDIRESLYQLGSITGEISTDDLLGNIFGKFCIGK